MSLKFTDATRLVVFGVRDGQFVSELFSALSAAEQATVLDPDPPSPPTQDELDSAAAKQYAKLVAMRSMTPAEVDAWVEANVNTFAQAKDALKTLAIAVSVLARRI